MGSIPDFTGSQVASTVAALLFSSGSLTDPHLVPEGRHPSPCTPLLLFPCTCDLLQV